MRDEAKKAEVLSRIDRLRDLVEEEHTEMLLEAAATRSWGGRWEWWRSGRGPGGREGVAEDDTETMSSM